jgi:O-antigen/teichoic acid export membrane protein
VTIARRLTAGFLANTMGKVWIILVQLITVPVLSVKWGAAGYGAWLMISTAPTYVALSSVGFGTAAAIDMTRSYARGDRDAVVATFQSVWVLITSILAAVLALTFLVWTMRGHIFAWFPALGAHADTFDAACLLVVDAALMIEMSYVGAGYQCSGRYAQGTFLYDLAFPIEGAVLVAACLLTGRMSVAALSMAVTRAIALIA